MASWASKLVNSGGANTTLVPTSTTTIAHVNESVPVSEQLLLAKTSSEQLSTQSLSVETLLQSIPGPSNSTVTPFKHLVVDTNAVIAGAGASLRGLSESFWTSPLALSEVKDERSRALFATLPFKIQTRVPSEESIDAIKAFATKTGDLRALSRVDLHLLALTYQFEREVNGLNGTPPSYIRVNPPSLPTELSKPVRNSAHVTSNAESNESTSSSTDLINGTKNDNNNECQEIDPNAAERKGAEQEEGDAEENNDESDVAFTEGVETTEEHDATSLLSASLPIDAAPSAPASTLHPFDVPGGEDGEGAWIGPTSSSSSSSSSSFTSSTSVFPTGIETSNDAATPRVPVACVTTDFAMQNVLLQMGLLLSTHSGKVVQSVKQWVLKCDACFSIFPISPTSLTDNMFCKWCGNATLNRLGVTLGIDGKPRYHYKKFRQINTRGTVYSLPAPKSGRASENGAKGQLLLRPDQLLTGAWKERLRQQEAASYARETLLMDRTVDDALGQRGGAFGGGGWIGPSGSGPGIGAGAAPIEYAYGRANPNSNRFHHRGHKR